MKNLTAWGVLLSLFCYWGCGNKSNPMNNASKSTSKSKAMREIVQVGCTDALSMTKGQILTLKLPASAGTGFLWRTKAAIPQLKSQDGDVLNYDKQADADATKVGTTNNQVLKFEATEAGTNTIHFEYVRPFDPANVAKTCDIKITVHE